MYNQPQTSSASYTKALTVQSLTIRGYITQDLMQHFTGLTELTLLEVNTGRPGQPSFSSVLKAHTTLRYLAVSLCGDWRRTVHDLRNMRHLQILTLRQDNQAQWLLPDGCQVRRVTNLRAARMLPQLPELTEMPPCMSINMTSGATASARWSSHCVLQWQPCNFYCHRC